MTRGFRSLPWIALCALAACAGARCDSTRNAAGPGSPAQARVRSAPRPDLRLLIVTDPRGYLEPCGCTERPLGGVDKLATLVAEARRDEVPTLLLAAGDLTAGSELRPEDADGARTQELWRAETFVEAWKHIGVTAAAPGALDLVQSFPRLSELTGRGGFPWIVDNSAQQARTPPPLASARIVEVQGLKIGVLGLSAPDPDHPPAPELGLTGDLAQTAARKTSELKAQGAEFVIALVSADRRTARAIASHSPDLVVMGGLDLERPLPPAVHGHAVLLHAGRQGQHLVTVDLGLRARGAWEDASEWTRREAQKERTREIGELRGRIASWEKDEKVDRNDLAAQRARLAELERQRDRADTPSFAGRWFRAELRELAPEVPGDPQIAAQLDAYDQRVNEHNRVHLAERRPAPVRPGSAAYAGSASCASCHAAAFDWWRQHKHGNAYATLEEVHKEYNLSCVGCHVTGYNQPGGSTVTHVEGLKNVGCESCHGPGSLHNAQPEEPGLVARAVPERVCAGCHTPEHSDHFVYASYKATLIVPGHGLPIDRK